MAVKVGFGQARCVKSWSGMEWQFWFVRFRSVAVCSGVVRQLRQGRVWFGRVRQGVAVKVGSGKVRPGKASCGLVWQLRQGRVWFGRVRQAKAWQLWQGKLRQVLVR